MMTKKLLTAGLVAGMAAMNIVPAFAEDVQKIGTGSETKPATCTIYKTLQLPEGTQSVPDETFTFNVDAQNGAPEIRDASISYSNKDALGTLTDKKYSIQKSTTLTLPDYTHAGEYVYNVTENNEKATNVGYDSNTYEMHVYVANKADGSGVYVKEITAKKGGAKQEKINFTNTYVAKSNLTISKNVAGDYGDHTKAFTFHLTLNHGALDSSTDTFTGKIGDTSKTFKAGESTDFTLTHGQSLTFENLPVGTTYTVTEDEDSNYTPSIKVNGTAVTNSDGSAVKTATGVMTDAANNTVDYTNTGKNITVTGVVMKNLPYLLLVAVGVIGMAFVMLSKSHKGSKE